MAINVNSNIGRISPMKTMTWARARDGANNINPAAGGQDSVAISREGRDSMTEQEELSPIERALQGTTREEIAGWMKEWERQHPLEVNRSATVDPDGSAYAKAYFDSIASQLDGARQTIESYYSDAHRENLSYADPYMHITEKYRYSGSPYFKSDWSQAQRDMAFRQETALLRGGRVVLNDIWALGGRKLPNAEESQELARNYAGSVIAGMVAEYKKAHGIEE